MSEPMHPIQALVNGMSQAWAKDRAESQMTLGNLIDALGELPPYTPVSGFGEPWSYRGYYEDLAFGDSEYPEPAGELKQRCQDCMGQVFEGWKGGNFPMHANTALWIAPSERGLGERLISLNVEHNPVIPVTEPEED